MKLYNVTICLSFEQAQCMLSHIFLELTVYYKYQIIDFFVYWISVALKMHVSFLFYFFCF